MYQLTNHDIDEICDLIGPITKKTISDRAMQYVHKLQSMKTKKYRLKTLDELKDAGAFIAGNGKIHLNNYIMCVKRYTELTLRKDAELTTVLSVFLVEE